MNQNDRCPECGGQANYPMLVSHEPRALCDHDFHRDFYDFAFRPKLWKYLKHRWSEL